MTRQAVPVTPSSALAFTTSNVVVLAKNNLDFVFDRTKNVSFSFYINSDQHTLNTDPFTMDSTTDLFYLRMETLGIWTFRQWDGAQWNAICPTLTPVDTGRTIHITVTVNRGATIQTSKIYLNGVLNNTVTGNIPSASTSILNFRMGFSSLSGVSLFAKLQRFRLFTTELSAAEVAANYYTGQVTRSTLAGEYLVGTGADATLYDTSPNGNNGAITGAVYTTQITPARRPVVGGNLIKNGDFEIVPPFTATTTANGRWIDGTVGGSTTNDIFGWSNYFSSGTGSVRFDPTTFYSGAASIKLSTLAVSSSVYASNVRNGTAATILATAIPITPGTPCSVTFRMKTTVNSGAATSGAFIVAKEKDGAGADVTNTPSTKVATTTDWRSYTITFTSSATTRFLTLEISLVGSDGTGTLIMDAWFDEISILPGAGRYVVQGLNSAIALDASNHRVLTSAIASPFTGAQPFSVESVVKISDYSTAAVVLYLSGGGSNYLLELDVRSSTLRWEKGSGALLVAYPIQPTPGVWHRVGYTFDGTTHTAFLNGIPVATSTTTPSSNTLTTASIGDATAAFTSIGARVSGFGIYNRKLSIAEMSSVAFNAVVPSGCVLKWRTNEGAGTSVTDFSGNGYNGTITGATFTGDTPSRKRPVVGGSLIKNWDFEYAPPFTAVTTTNGRWIDGTAAGSTTNDLFGWGNYSEYACTFNYDSTVKKNGAYSMKIATQTTAPSNNHQNSINQWPVAQNATTASSYLVPVTAGASYIVSGWIKTDSITNNNGRGARFNATTYSGDTTGSTAQGATSFVSGTTDWTFYSTTIVISAARSWLSVSPEIRGESGTAWFDDITVTLSPNTSRPTA